MKYFILLFLILTLGGCFNQAKEFTRSSDIITRNTDVLANARENIKGIEKIQDKNNEEIEKLLEEEDIPEPVLDPENETNNAIIIPETFDLPVKFVSQAPFEIWDALHKDACEEAAMIMVVKYLRGEDLDKQIMEDEIVALIKWEEERGYKKDLTAQEAVDILENYFRMDAWTEKDVSVDKIKEELSLGNLIITPHAGRQLGNPYYNRPGPLYHYLVIRGWTQNEFITNDEGTKRGEAFKYSYNKIIETVHDWNDGGNILDGEKVMIVVGK
ncbi:C39 family peptidase [Candidatus Falkowbacteria bacterium]|nr:C39 family peptidase [Candidatus Falkowbacteria bacterium]